MKYIYLNISKLDEYSIKYIKYHTNKIYNKTGQKEQRKMAEDNSQTCAFFQRSQEWVLCFINSMLSFLCKFRLLYLFHKLL